MGALGKLTRLAHSFLSRRANTHNSERLNNPFHNALRNLFEKKRIPPLTISSHMMEESVRNACGQFEFASGASLIDQVCSASRYINDELTDIGMQPDASFSDAMTSTYQKKTKGLKYDANDIGESDLWAATCLNSLYTLGAQFHDGIYSQEDLAANTMDEGNVIYARQISYLHEEAPPVAIEGLGGNDALLSKLVMRGDLSRLRSFMTRGRTQDEFSNVSDALTVMLQQKGGDGPDYRTPDQVYEDIKVSNRMGFSADMFMRVKTLALSLQEASMKAANGLIEHYRFLQQYGTMDFIFSDEHINEEKAKSELSQVAIDILSTPVHFEVMQTKMLAPSDISLQPWVAYVPENLIQEVWIFGNFTEISIPLMYVHKLITKMTSAAFEETYHLANSSEDYMLRRRDEVVITMTHEDADGKEIPLDYYRIPSDSIFHKVKHKFHKKGPYVDCVMVGTAWLMAPLLGSNDEAVDHPIVAKRLPHIVYGANLDAMLYAVSELPSVQATIGSEDFIETFFEKEWNN